MIGVAWGGGVVVKPLEAGDPQQAGKYLLLGVLGSGGMGRVFLGRSPGGRLVAVKLIRVELAGDPDFRARFAREVATARTVSGIFTVPVVDANLEGPQPWLVTAYVDGPSLAEAVGGHGPLPAGSVLSLAAGLAEGLGVIHGAGVVHRDLKPSNVLLASDGPRIIDFGISRAMDAAGATRTGWVAGSPGFMSPEQAEGSEAGPASDIFSLGAVLAFAATGKEPFGTGAATALLYRVVHSLPDTSGLPAEIRPLIERCLTKDPRQRPTTDQILTELTTGHPAADGQAWPAASPVQDTPGQPVPEPPGPARTHSPQPGGRFPGPPTRTSATLRHPHDGLNRPAPPANGSQLTRPSRRPRKWTWATGALAAALAVTAGALAITAVALTHRFTTAPPTAPPVTRPARPTAARPAQSAASPAGQSWAGYQDPSGFSIKLPAGWAASSRTTDEVHFTGQPPGFVVVVAWTTHPQADQLADWRQQSAAKAQSDPTYQQIRIQRVTYRGYNAADWEFTNIYQGELTHVIDRGFIVQPGHLAYAIELYGPSAQWPPVYASMWASLVTSFEPAA
jgi:eukaryotic-like serine/threonine-protein kinase